MFRFAIKTLLADRGKLLTALVGVIFSLVLVNIQGGLFLGLIRKASLLVDHCDADIWIGHKGLENVDFAENIPSLWVNRIRGLPEIIEAQPYIVGKGMMSLPHGDYEDIWIIGSDPKSMLGGPWRFAVGSSIDDLHRPHGISIETVEAWKLGDPELGDVVEINGARAKVVTRTEGIVGFLTTPYCFTTIDRARAFSRIDEEFCSYFLVKCRPEIDLQAVKQRIQSLLPETEAFTAAELSTKSRVYWMLRTGIGVSFGTATALGLIVGLVMVGQSLYAQALDHLTDYATLKAIGAEDGNVYEILFVQAMCVATIGIALGSLAVVFLQRIGSTPYAPIVIPPQLFLASVALVLFICVAASILPFRRIRSVDPISVLQG